MEELTRRTFLTGIAKVAAAGGLIVAASDEAVQAFAGVGHPVSVLAPERPFIESGIMATTTSSDRTKTRRGKAPWN